MNMIEQQRSRWSWDPARADLAKAGKIFAGAHAAIEACARKKAELAADDGLSPAGRERAFREWAKLNFRAELLMAEARLTAERERLAKTRDALKRPVIDRGDQLAAAERAELRARILELPYADRVELALADDVIAEAVLSGHPLLTGLKPPEVEHVAAAFAARQHADELVKLDDLEAALMLADQAQGFAVAQVEEAAALERGDFATWWNTGREPSETRKGETITRAEFETLPPHARVSTMRAGVVLDDKVA